MAATTLSITVAHAVAYLTKPLVYTHPATTVTKLQTIIEANLTSLYASTWTPDYPLKGSARRCLTFTRNAPPRFIYNACSTCRVNWQEWMHLLGGQEFDLYVDPGRVYCRSGDGSTMTTIWSAQPTSAGAPLRKTPAQDKKAFAQEIMIIDRESEEELFSALRDEMDAPTWVTPVNDKFNLPSHPPRSSLARSDSPLSVSSSSSGASFSSCEIITAYTASKSTATISPVSSIASMELPLAQPRIFIDTSKKDVTDYDSGKVGVLTGGVMLGSPIASPRPNRLSPTATSPIARPNWRSTRF